MTTAQREAIINHGQNLKAIFPDCKLDPLALCRRLRRVEARISAVAVRACNVGMSDAAWDKALTAALSDVAELLGAGGPPIHVNGDPRGYALKIDDSWMAAHPDARLHRDWGGYGIIAPEISPDGR